MTLTPNDLLAIRKVVKEEVRDELQGYPTKQELKQTVRDELQGYPTKQELKQAIKAGLKQINTKLDITINFFDKDYLKLKARVDRMERFLKIPPFEAL